MGRLRKSKREHKRFVLENKREPSAIEFLGIYPMKEYWSIGRNMKRSMKKEDRVHRRKGFKQGMDDHTGWKK